MAWAIHGIEQLDTLAQEWTAICAESHQAHPLLDPKFLRPLLDHFSDSGVRLAVDRDDSQVQSLVFVQRKGWGVWETFSPSQLPLCPAVTRRSLGWEQSWKQGLLRALPGYVGMLAAIRYDSLYFPNTDSGSDPAEIVEYATTMSVDLDGVFTDYWKGRRKKLRDNLSRYFRRVDSENRTYRFEVATEAVDVRDATREYGDLESSGWKGREGTALHESNTQGRFYRQALDNFAAQGKARVYRLVLDERLVASRLAIVQNGILVFLKTTYDEGSSRLAPGRLLLYLVLEELFGDPTIRVAEFYTNANRDLLQWATHSRPICHVNLYRSRWFQTCVQTRRLLQERLAGTPG